MKTIKDIHKKIIKNGDKVYNHDVKKYGTMKYYKKLVEKNGIMVESGWWYFYADEDRSIVGIPDFISEDPKFGIEKNED